MSPARRFPRPILGALAALLASHCATPVAPGELVMVLQTDLSLPKDVDAVQLSVLVRGDPRLDQVFDQLGADGSLKIPASLGVVIQDNGDPTTPVTFRVTAFRNGTPKILREVVTTIPPDRVAALRLPVQWLCWDQVQVDDQGKPSSSCPDGKTCVTGSCVDKTIDASKLANYDDAQVFGGGSGKGDGACFDVAGCFTGSLDAKVDLAACTIASGNNVNVAIRVEAAGICGVSGCFVPLDAESEFGWKTGESGLIQLPTTVCDRINDNKATGVSVAAISEACKQKTEGLPACGPWSSAGASPPAPGSVTPVALVANQNHPVSLSIGGLFVYWTNSADAATASGAVKRMPLSGGTTGTQLGNLAFPRDLALDRDANGNAKAVYFATAGVGGKPGGITGVDLKSQPAKTLLFNPPGLVSPEGVALSGTKLFFTDFGGEAVYAIDLGVMAKPTSVIASPATGSAQNSPYRIVADSTTIFWVNEGKPGKPGSVMMANQQDPTPTLIAMDQGTPRSLVLDLTANVATAVYWTNFSTGEVMKAPLSGTPVVAGAPVQVAAGQESPGGIALDATSVYWTNRAVGEVMKAPKAGGPAVMIAKNQAAPGSIVVDADTIYWVNEGSSTKPDGALVRLSKSAPPL
ncbi:MAG: hypothetical protein ABI193_01990 [Minicystis sp.]